MGRTTCVCLTVVLTGLPTAVASAQSAALVTWTRAVNTTVAAGAVTKSGGCDGCPDAGAVSEQRLSGDGYVEFVPGGGQRLFAGLGCDLSADPAASAIDYAFSFWPDGSWDIRERGVYRAEGRFTAGDRFRVSVQGGAVKYLHNGAVVYSSSAAATFPLALDATLFTVGGTLGEAVIGAITTTEPPPPPPPSPGAVFDTTGTYAAYIDRLVRPRPAVPAIGPAGSSWTDAVFGSRMWRITDAQTRPGLLNRSYRTPSSVHQNAWNASGTRFYIVSTDGTVIPYRFDPATASASRIDPVGTDDGGLVLRLYGEPQFSYLSDSLIYGSYSGFGATLRTIDQYDFSTGAYSTLLDLDALVPGLSGTYIGWIGSSAGPVERIATFFGGDRQDLHRYALVFDKADPSKRQLVDTVASTVNGAPANITLNFLIHAMAIDRSGRYTMIYPRGPDLGAPRNAAPGYLWDLATNTFTALPAIEAVMGGHDAYGYGVRVNQACCTAGTWDAAQWQFRPLAAPFTTRDLIAPVLQPKVVYMADHPSWHNARPDRLVPFVSALYRYGTDPVDWRAWDGEILAVQTDAAAGAGAAVWRFAHHRSDVRHDSEPGWISFWYTPRPSVSPDGRWALFTSNWEKTLGTDPGADRGGAARQDVFLVELRMNGAPQPPPPPTNLRIVITTSALPQGRETLEYSAPLEATGGSGAYTWSLQSGPLPSGLTLDSTAGRISGVPQAAGSAYVAVQAADTWDPTNAASLTLPLTITPAVGIVTSSLPEGARSSAYSAQLIARDVRGGAVWDVTSGSLPPGLALDPASGWIYGTPRRHGTWTFTVGVADDGTSATRTLRLAIRKFI